MVLTVNLIAESSSANLDSENTDIWAGEEVDLASSLLSLEVV
ncbi:MAG: hypothetical protein AAGA22_04680 [Pseudomonadota bacterium]